VTQHAPFVRQRPSPTERTVGQHAGVERIYCGRRHAAGGQRGSDDARAQPFAVADDGIDDFWGRLTDQANAARQVAQFVKQRIEQMSVEFKASEDLAMADGDQFGVRCASRRGAGDGKQRIGDASVRGNDDHGFAVQLTTHHFDSLTDGDCTSNRGATELHNDHDRIMQARAAREKGDRVLPLGVTPG
jgi:hypothetical protein